MSLLSPPPRPHSRASETASVTTYHSFRDAEPHEPEASAAAAKTAVGPYARRASTPPPSGRVEKESKGAREGWPVAPEMRRQDSGYESLPSRPSRSGRRQTTPTESSTMRSSSPTSASRPRKHPAIRRAFKTRSAVSLHRPNSTSHGIYAARSYPSPALREHHYAFLHFPPYRDGPSRDDRDEYYLAEGVLDPYDVEHAQQTATGAPPADRSAYPVPPQTTHYWTSDRTRRLEYAAIDAAGRGIRGWVRKHMLPDCFVPKERRRVGFDDDGGSVRRYRIELECDDEKSGDGDDRAEWTKRRKSWWDIF